MSEQQIQKVKVKRLAHIGLWVTDVIAQVRFYRKVLGFNLRTTEQSSPDQDVELEDANAFLSLGDEHHCLGLFSDTRPTPSNGRSPGQHYLSPREGTLSGGQVSRLHHLSLEVDTEAELAALAARLNQSGIELSLEPRDGDSELGDTLWFRDPDGNRIEISVTSDDALTLSAPSESLDKSGPTVGAINRGGTINRSPTTRARLYPQGLQHVALSTPRLEEMVEFYTEALGFDISDWLLRDCVWLRCNTDHHTIVLMQGKQGIDHAGYSISNGAELLAWADALSRQRTPILWGPGRHGAGNDLFLRFADAEGVHIELSAELQQYYDRDVTTPPRLWHTRPMALNLWGVLPAWIREEVRA